MWIIDTYRYNNRIVAWYKTRSGEDTFCEYSYETCIYAEDTGFARRSLDRAGIEYNAVTATDAYNQDKQVLQIDVPRIQYYEAFVREVERVCKYDVKLYNADIPPAQRWLYDHGVRPYDEVSLDDADHPELRGRTSEPELDRADLSIETRGDVRSDASAPIERLAVDNNVFGGDERELLEDFAAYFDSRDPDAVFMQYAFRYLPHIAERMRHHNISFSFHRSHPTKLTYRGGQSFFSYGNVFYRDYAVRLHGRLVVDRNTYLGEETGVEGIVELAKLSGTRTQHLASWSFGAVTQGSLVRELVQDEKLVPHKHKPLSQPMRLSDYVTADKGGHYYDPEVGVHKDVAAIDFSSMFPTLICKYNICAEAILNDEEPRNHAPGIPVSMHKDTGLLADVLRPIMNRREAYKQQPQGNEDKIYSLKGVLVSSYGYLRYREFKMGLAEAHMAICAYAREHLVESAHIAEDHGARPIHGLVDSLYVKQRGMTREQAQTICDDIEEETGLRIGVDGVLDWVVFLKSKTDPRKPVVTRYYGVWRDGEPCVKGLTAVQDSKPGHVKAFQRDLIQAIDRYGPDDVAAGERAYASLLRDYAAKTELKGAKALSYTTKIRKTEYEQSCVQQRVIDKLRRRGITVFPGYTLTYVYGRDGVVLPEAYDGQPDVDHYTEALVDAALELLRPFGYDEHVVAEWAKPTRQVRLTEHVDAPRIQA